MFVDQHSSEWILINLTVLLGLSDVEQVVYFNYHMDYSNLT